MTNKQSIQRLRSAIDTVDMKILHCIHKRQELSRAIAREKRQHHMPITDQKREKQLIINRQTNGAALEIQRSVVKQIFSLLIQESKRIQKEVI